MKGCISKRKNVSIMALIPSLYTIQITADIIIENFFPAFNKFGGYFNFNQNNYIIKHTTISFHNMDI